MPLHSTHSFAELTEDDLFSQLDQDTLPRHVAVIMDGNGRWASHRGLPRIAGHREGLIAVREVLNTFYRLGVPIVTVYAFSRENWNRPQAEIDLLMMLLEEFLLQERQTFHERKTRFFPIGLLHELPASTQDLVHAIARETEHFTDQTVVVALSYGGRSEIIDATNRLIEDIQCGKASGRCSGSSIRAVPVHGRSPGPGPPHSNERGSENQQFPALANRVYRALFYENPLARLSTT